MPFPGMTGVRAISRDGNPPTKENPGFIEVIIVPGPHGTPVPVVCTRDNKPLDQVSWQSAVAGMPPMADPVQWRLEDLPQTATTKIKRLELARLLTGGGPAT